MPNVFISPSDSGVPNINSFKRKLVPSVYRCMQLVDKPDVMTHGKWISNYYDSRWVATALIDAHDKLVAHLATRYLYKKYKHLFSYEPLDYALFLDSVLDNITLDLYDHEDHARYAREILEHFENLESLYRQDIEYMLEDDLLDGLQFITGHIEMINFSTADMILTWQIQ